VTRRDEFKINGHPIVVNAHEFMIVVHGFMSIGRVPSRAALYMMLMLGFGMLIGLLVLKEQQRRLLRQDALLQADVAWPSRRWRGIRDDFRTWALGTSRSRSLLFGCRLAGRD
jgi:hypothetical protein